MTYKEIMNISDIQEKENKLIEFYINEVEINDWLTPVPEKQCIYFKDRIEYKTNGQFHRLTGPAIEYVNGSKGIFYIFGELLEEKDWKKKSTLLLREKKLKRTLNQ